MTQAKKTTAMTKLFEKTSFIPVLTITDLTTTIPLAKALSEGGVKVIEVALRSPQAFDAIKILTKECPEMTVGAATIMSTQEMDAAIAAGAQFGASPMFDIALLHHAKEKNFPYVPCVSNLAETNAAAQAGYQTLKLFPMDAMGDNEDGEKYLRGNKGMHDKLGVTFCTSCLETKPGDIEKYLKHPHVRAVASGWSAPADLVANKNWPAITQMARQHTSRAQEVLAAKANGTLDLNRRLLRMAGNFRFGNAAKLGLAFFSGATTATLAWQASQHEQPKFNNNLKL